MFGREFWIIVIIQIREPWSYLFPALFFVFLLSLSFLFPFPSWSFSVFFFSFFFSSLCSLYFQVGGSRQPLSFFFFFFSFFGVGSEGLFTLIWGIHPEGNTLLRLAMLRGMKAVATLLEATDRMLPLRSVSGKHTEATVSAEWMQGVMCDTEPLLWHTELPSRSFCGCFFTSSTTASRLFPTSGGLVGSRGWQPVTTSGLWMLVVMRTMWSITPFSWGSRGKLNPNVFLIRSVIFSADVFWVVARVTLPTRSGHSGT